MQKYVSAGDAAKAFLLVKAATQCTRVLRVLGLLPDGDALGWTAAAHGGTDDKLVDAFYAFRQGLRSCHLSHVTVNAYLSRVAANAFICHLSRVAANAFTCHLSPMLLPVTHATLRCSWQCKNRKR